MKTKLFLPFLILSLTLVFAIFLNSKILAQPSAILAPEQLSDHDQTVSGSILDSTSAATQNAVHLAWIEPITESFGSPDNWGLFYRQLPNGSTTNLTNLANTIGNPWSPFIQVGENDNVCVVWRDQALSGDYYLFLWNSALDTITRSPSTVDGSLSGNGSFTFLPFNCDAQNDAKVVWYSIYSNTEITLWDLASNQQKRISNNSNITIQSLHMAEINDVLYLAWPESGNIYLWDSVSETAQEIDSSGWAGSLSMYSDKNDVIHMFWLLSGYMGPPCHRYWNSVDQTNELIMDCDDWLFSVVKDGEENVHAAWAKYIGVTPVTHWNATENISSTISIQDQAVENMKLIAGSDNRAHIFWQDFVTNDLYYWNSQEKNPTSFATAADNNVIHNYLVWDFDSTGKIHVSWSDGGGWDDIFYWNPTLSTPKTVLTGQDVIIVVDEQDVAHVAFISIHEIPGPRIYLWNNQTNVPVFISSTPIPDFYNFTVTNGIEYVLFGRSTDELYYWSSDEGEISLGIGKELSYIVDESEKIFLYWTAFGFIEQDDMFAAWTKQESNFIYLPFVISD